MTKRCSKCGEVKSLDEFVKRSRSERARSEIKHKGYCRDCATVYRRNREEKLKDAHLTPVDRELCPLISEAPIREWLESRVSQFDTYADLAGFCDISPETIGRLLTRRLSVIRLDTVDKILCAFGRPDLLACLYPDLYDFPEPPPLPAVERVKKCASCGETKPWSLYYPGRKWEDGSTRFPMPRCKECERERQREYRRTRPDAHRDRCRSWRARKIEEDPQFLAREAARIRAIYAHRKDRAA